MAHEGHCLPGVLACKAAHDAEYPLRHRLDALIAGQQAAPGFVDEPQGPAHRDLPVRHALEVAGELRLQQLRIGLEDRRLGQFVGDDAGGFGGAVDRAVDDPPDPGLSQALTELRSLGASERAEVESRQVTVQQPMWILDVRVPDQIEPVQRR